MYNLNIDHMYFLKKCSKGLRLSLIVFFFTTVLAPLRAQVPSSLVNGQGANEKLLMIGDSVSPADSIIGLTAHFSGDFHGVDPSTLTPDWANSWFGDSLSPIDHDWFIAIDSLHATLDILRTDSVGKTGYGEFLKLIANGINDIVLDDAEKRYSGQAIRLKPAPRKNKQGLKIWPQPSVEGQLMLSHAELQPGCLLQLRSASGRVAARATVTRENEMSWDLRHLPPGLYFLSLTGSDGRLITSRSILLR